MTHPADLSAADLLGLYRKKALSPVAAVDAVLDRIASLNPVFNAFRLVEADVARAQARQSEARWQRSDLRAGSMGCQWRSRTCCMCRAGPPGGAAWPRPMHPQRKTRLPPHACVSTVPCCSGRPTPLNAAGRA
jgi:hypothetical protein